MKKLKADPSKTILIISLGFTIIFLVTKTEWFVYIAIAIGLAGIFSDYLARKIDFLWMKLAWVLSKIVPNILLGLVFYFIVFPISVVSKIFNSNSNQLNLKNKSESLFKDQTKEFDKASFEKPW